MTVVVCDASALVAVLLDAGDAGGWVTDRLRAADLAAPDLLPYEVANVLRRHERAARITADSAAQAHADLLDLSVELWPHAALARRVWELRHNLSVYDAAYVAVAERLDAPLITLDARIADAPGVRCSIERMPPPASS